MVETFAEPLLDTDTAVRRLGVSPSERPRVRTDATNTAPQIGAHDPQEIHLVIPAKDRPMCLRDAAHALGVPYHVVQRAARRRLVPTYRLGTSRPYVKLRDFFDLMERSANR
jgi:hypothetical protein